MSIEIHPSAIVEDGAELADGVRVGPFCHIGAQVSLGPGNVLYSHVTLMGRTCIGNECAFYPGTTIGAPPQSIGFRDDPASKVEIGDHCTFRENTSVHAGIPSFNGTTKIGNECFFMVGSHLAHDCIVGDQVVLANSAVLGGHVEVADNVWFGGMVAVHQFTRIGRHAFIGGGSILVDDVIPFGSVIGNRASLAGLNIIGLKRRGFSRGDIAELRKVYRAVFRGDGMMADRVDAAAVTFAGSPLAMEMIDFIRADKNRPVCKPMVKHG